MPLPVMAAWSFLPVSRASGKHAPLRSWPFWPRREGPKSYGAGAMKSRGRPPTGHGSCGHNRPPLVGCQSRPPRVHQLQPSRESPGPPGQCGGPLMGRGVQPVTHMLSQGFLLRSTDDHPGFVEACPELAEGSAWACPGECASGKNISRVWQLRSRT